MRVKWLENRVFFKIFSLSARCFCIAISTELTVIFGRFCPKHESPQFRGLTEATQAHIRPLDIGVSFIKTLTSLCSSFGLLNRQSLSGKIEKRK
jgi:hypothetical protein